MKKIFAIILVTIMMFSFSACGEGNVDKDYNNALSLMNEGKFAEAISIFETLDGYKDSKDNIAECKLGIKYNDAIALMNAGKYTEAISELQSLGGYKDSSDKINDCNVAILDGKYNDAVTSMNAGNIIEAYEAFIILSGYKDSDEKATSIFDKYKTEKLKTAKVGDYVFLGKYEQDNNASNGLEDIEWRVLEIKDGKILVISKYILDLKKYNSDKNEVLAQNKMNVWETCSLRSWLNNDFINSAFSAEEQTMIPSATVANPNEKSSGKDTQDKIFILSETEVEKYLSSNVSNAYEAASKLWCDSTAYVKELNPDIIDSTWWLRTDERHEGLSNSSSALMVRSNLASAAAITKESVDNSYVGVRPVLWIDIA